MPSSNLPYGLKGIRTPMATPEDWCNPKWVPPDPANSTKQERDAYAWKYKIHPGVQVIWPYLDRTARYHMARNAQWLVDSGQ